MRRSDQLVVALSALGAGSGLALVAGVSLGYATAGAATAGGALVAYALALLLLAGLAQGPKRGPSPPVPLLVVGVVVSAVAAWLVPQRADVISALQLSALFGIGAGLSLAARPSRRGSRPLPSGRGAATVSAAVVGLELVVVICLRAAGARTALLWLATALVAGGAAAGVLRRSTGPAPEGEGPNRSRRSNTRSWAVGSAVTLSTLAFVAYIGASTVTIGWFGGGVRHGDRQRREVAITFDDGPNDGASWAIAEILDAHQAKGTFFLVGRAIDARPALVRKLYDDGQLLGNHSYHHDQWRWLDPGYPELDRTDAAFARRLGTCPAFYRPPHGQRTPLLRRVVDAHHMRLVMWDVSTSDWTTTDAAAVAQRVVARAKPGSIIDLHDGLDGDPTVDRTVVVRALPMILEGLARKHLRPVRLDQLIGGPAYLPCKVTSTATAPSPGSAPPGPTG